MGESNLNQKKCVFKEPGTIDTRLFYIVSGSLKITISDNSDEHIIRFGYTNNFITALDSFITEKPSEFAIQAIKKTDLKIISKRDFLAFLDKMIDYSNCGKHSSSNCFCNKCNAKKIF